jgi:phosphoribosylglycinamide formyltransferase 1
MTKLAIFASHSGTNMQAIVDACTAGILPMTPSVLISNNSHSSAIQRAVRERIPYYHVSSHTHPIPGDLDNAVCGILLHHKIDLVVLAGYMKSIGPQTLKCFRNRIINIHPALLPKYGGKDMYGLNVHKAVIGSHEPETGVTVHLVDDQYDHGRILRQMRIPIPEDVTAEDLQRIVLSHEHAVYVETLIAIAKGEIALDEQPSEGAS